MHDEAFFTRLVAEAPDGVMYSDAKGIISVWNKGCERIFGFTAQEAIGQSLDIIIPPALRQRHWQGYDETIRTGHTRYGAGDLLAVPALRKDGTRISVQFSIIPLTAANVIVGMGAILRDVTQQFEERKALLKAAAAAKKA